VKPQETLQEVLVDAATTHFDHCVLRTGHYGVLDEEALVVLQPVLGPPPVHDHATTSFVNGFAPEE
jgi:hypothetical protein